MLAAAKGLARALSPTMPTGPYPYPFHSRWTSSFPCIAARPPMFLWISICSLILRLAFLRASSLCEKINRSSTATSTFSDASGPLLVCVLDESLTKQKV